MGRRWTSTSADSAASGRRQRAAAVTPTRDRGSHGQLAYILAVILEIVVSSPLNSGCVHGLRQALSAIGYSGAGRIADHYADVCVPPHLYHPDQQDQQQWR